MKQSLHIAPKNPVCGVIDSIATDKSISHRCVIFSLLTQKTSKIRGFLQAEDTLHTLKIAQALGLGVKWEDECLYLTPNQNGIQEPLEILDCGNAGTAMRLYCGLLSATPGYFVLSGDSYLNKRPMKRVIAPLKEIGAHILGREEGNFAPISLIGKPLKAFDYQSLVASAQVKSAMILAALHANGVSRYKEPEKSRDHSEKMLRAMGASIIENPDQSLSIHPLTNPLDPIIIDIPSDPSSAFFFAVAAAITPGSAILLKNILLNPTRIEAFEILKRMGAVVEYQLKEEKYDQMGDIFVQYAPLSSIEVSSHIAWLIDEIPALAIAMARAQGKSCVKGAKELRVKECDRIAAIVRNLCACGIQAKELEDGFEIEGGEFQSTQVDSFGDHRIAMSFALIGLLTPITITDAQAMVVSFPNFATILDQYTKIQ